MQFDAPHKVDNPGNYVSDLQYAADNALHPHDTSHFVVTNQVKDTGYWESDHNKDQIQASALKSLSEDAAVFERYKGSAPDNDWQKYISNLNQTLHYDSTFESTARVQVLDDGSIEIGGINEKGHRVIKAGQ